MSDIKPVLLFVSPIACRAGYGERARDLAKCFLRMTDKYDVKFVSTRWGGTPMNALDNPSDPINKEIVSRILTAPLQAQPEIHIQLTIPNEFQPVGKYNIGITAGIETTLPRGEWIEGLNKMDVNFVSSEFSKMGLVLPSFTKVDHRTQQKEEIKCRKPVEVLFEGADLNIYKKTSDISSEIKTIFNEVKEDFCFLFVGHWLQGIIGEDRKNVGMLIKTFLETFKNKKKAPALVLKTSVGTLCNMDKYEVLKRIKEIKDSVNAESLPTIYLVHGDLTDEEMNSLYNHPKIKAHISLTHGEGFGRPLLEASLSGKPVIASDWSGHKDFLNPQYAVLLPGEVKKVHPSSVNEWIVADAQWFSPNYTVVTKTLEEVFNNYSKFTSNGEKLRLENQKYSIDTMYEKLDALLSQYLPRFEVKKEFNLPKLIKKPKV